METQFSTEGIDGSSDQSDQDKTVDNTNMDDDVLDKPPYSSKDPSLDHSDMDTSGMDGGIIPPGTTN